MAFGGISGYINTDVELKTGLSGIEYVSILLGRGRDQHGNNLPSYSIAFFGQDAKRLAEQIKKGDLIRITSLALNPILEDGQTLATSFKIVGKEFEVIA